MTTKQQQRFLARHKNMTFLQMAPDDKWGDTGKNVGDVLWLTAPFSAHPGESFHTVERFNREEEAAAVDGSIWFPMCAPDDGSHFERFHALWKFYCGRPHKEKLTLAERKSTRSTSGRWMNLRSTCPVFYVPSSPQTLREKGDFFFLQIQSSLIYGWHTMDFSGWVHVWIINSCAPVFRQVVWTALACSFS